MMLPAFAYYAKGAGLKTVTHGYYNSVFMLGNLGFNKAVCVSAYTSQTSVNPTDLVCEVGTFTEIDHFGIIPNTQVPTWKNIAYGYCGDAFSSDIGTELP